jgi:GWxTD domain-containing protein
MNKKSLLAAIGLLLLTSFNLRADKEDKYEKWLNEEVSLIITDAEKAEFKKLKNEKDIDFFIKLFWAKRDPTPQTEKNEFKEEYYKRLNYVRKAFLYGYKSGIETDMGKVYIYFGKPKVFHPSSAPSTSQQGFPPEIWIYATQPWMDLPKKTFSFFFAHDGIGYVIDRDQTDFRVMQAFFSYPKRTLLRSDLKDLPFQKKSALFAPESFEAKLIQQVKSSREDIVQIPFEEKMLFTKAENESTYLTFLFKIDPGKKSEIGPKKFVLFGSLEADGHSYDFRQEKNLREEENYFISQAGLPVPPGEYKLFLGLFTQDNKLGSIKMEPVTVPDFWSEELALSSLLASAKVSQEKTGDKKEEFDVFSFGRYALLPRFSQSYTKDESLNLFYYIYNMGRDENQNCSLLIELELQKGEKKFQLNPQRRQRNVGEEAAILEGTQIPLSALPESGEYELKVKVIDELTQQTASEKLKFSLI